MTERTDRTPAERRRFSPPDSYPLQTVIMETREPDTTMLLRGRFTALEWQHILVLPLAGILLGTGSVFGLTRGFGPYLWILLACGAAATLSRKARMSTFLHGFITGFLAGVLDGATKAVLYPLYAASNPDAAAELARIPSYVSPQMFLLMVGPVFGTVYGGILGFLTWASVRLFVRHRGKPAGPDGHNTRA